MSNIRDFHITFSRWQSTFNLILVGLLKIVFVRQVFLVVFFIAPATGARRAMQMLRRRPGVH